MKKYLSIVLTVLFVAITASLVLFDTNVLTKGPSRTEPPQSTSGTEGLTDAPLVGETVSQNNYGLPEGNYSKGLLYALDDNGSQYYIAGIGSCKDTDIIVSPTYRGKPIVGIRDRAFEYNDTIESFSVIRDTEGKNSLFYIGIRAFYSCQKLKRVTISAQTLSLPSEVFANCPKLKEIDISKTKIYSIGTGAFKMCTSLRSISLSPVSWTILDEVFSGCAALESITLPSYMTNLGESVFRGCTSLKSVVLPDNLKKIPNSTFFGCLALTEITIPDTVTAISDSAFRTCVSLKSLNIPKNVSDIALNAFTGCISLEDISVSKQNGHFYVDDGKLISKSDDKVIFERTSN